MGIRTLVCGATTAIAAMGLVGCGGDPSALPAVTVTEAAETVTVTPEAPDGTQTPSPPAVDLQPTATPLGDATVLEPERAGQELDLDDAVNVRGNWSESRFQVSDRSEARGLGVLVDCGLKDRVSLELRLARRFDTLEFTVGQDNNSPTSQQTLVVEVTGNQEQLDLRRIEFDQVQPFTLSVSSINAVIIKFDVEEPCDNSDEIIAVVEALKVT